MIIDKLYETDSSDSYYKATKTIDEIPIETEQFTDAYWLGWAKHENIPKHLNASIFETLDITRPETGEPDKLIRIKNIQNKNIYRDIVICYNRELTFTNHSVITPYFYSDNSSKWIGIQSYNNSGYYSLNRLLNSFSYQEISKRYVQLFFRISVNANTNTFVEAYITIKDFKDFVFNNKKLSFISSYFQEYFGTTEINVSCNDFLTYNDNTIHFTYNNKDAYFYLSGYAFAPVDVVNLFPTCFRTPYILDGANKDCIISSIGVMPSTVLSLQDPGVNNVSTNAYDDMTLCLHDTTNDYNNYNNYHLPHCSLGIETELYVSELDNLPIVKGNTCIDYILGSGGYPYYASFHPIIDIREVWKHAGYYRWVVGDSNITGYQKDVIYYPKVDLETNEFLGDLITGDSEVENLIPIWMRQGHDITENEYKESDKPVPTPPTDEDEITTERHNNENSLPALSGIRIVSGNAFSTFYRLSMYHVAELGNLLSQMSQTFWEALGTATDYKQSNILDYLVSLKWYPINILDDTDVITTDLQFGFNGVSNVSFTVAGTSYKVGNINRIYNMGSITIPYRLGDSPTFLDLEPYTNVSAYFPYIGTVGLQANDVLGYTITCTYIVDLTTGMCTCILDNGIDTIYVGTGKIGVDISVSGNDILTQSEKMASSYIGAASGAVNNALSIGTATASENVVGMVSASASAVTDLAASAISIANSKRGIPETVGSASGFGGGYTHQSPYIKVQRPAVSIPGKYGHDIGYVCNRSYTIGTLTGFTVCENPDLSGISATTRELDIIKNILCTGFYA